MTAETFETVGYYISSVGFLAAFILMWINVAKFGKSTVSTILSYILIGNGVFFAITIFQKLGEAYFGVSDASMDILWHMMFYTSFITYLYGIKSLADLSSVSPTAKHIAVGAEKKWAAVVAIIIAIIFVVPKTIDPAVQGYSASAVGMFGLHHFIAFALAGGIAIYLLTVRNKLGQIGKAIANPMLVAITSFSAQHLWELLNESWHVIEVSGEFGEGIEKVMLTVASIALIFVAMRLKKFTQS